MFSYWWKYKEWGYRKVKKHVPASLQPYIMFKKTWLRRKVGIFGKFYFSEWTLARIVKIVQTILQTKLELWISNKLNFWLVFSIFNCSFCGYRCYNHSKHGQQVWYVIGNLKVWIITRSITNGLKQTHNNGKGFVCSAYMNVFCGNKVFDSQITQPSFWTSSHNVVFVGIFWRRTWSQILYRIYWSCIYKVHIICWWIIVYAHGVGKLCMLWNIWMTTWAIFCLSCLSRGALCCNLGVLTESCEMPQFRGAWRL